MWSSEKTRKIQELLLEWYHRHKRDLPWRRRPRPYRVWVSEIMLQQTQVQTVIPYYVRFLKRFPTLEALAKANAREVLASWAGLGYYSRARNLHRAARMIMRNYQGKFPATLEEIRKLPGVGRYTAGAIASIAFNQPAPIVDGNVRRVISRLHGIEQRMSEGFYWEQAKNWIPEGKAPDFNQAMMELGALVCLPSSPLCPACPIASLCEARKRGIQNRISASRTMPPPETVRSVMLVLESNRRILLSRQRDAYYIPGEWGLPTSVLKDRDTPELAAQAMARDLALGAISLELSGRVRHGITFRRILIDVFHGKTLNPAQQLSSTKEMRWVSFSVANRLLTSSAFRKALSAGLGAKTVRPAKP